MKISLTYLLTCLILFTGVLVYSWTLNSFKMNVLNTIIYLCLVDVFGFWYHFLKKEEAENSEQK